MKRLDRYLLTHHPLVWNMRLHWVLPVLLALHALFYLGGLAEPQRLTRLNYQSTSFQPVAASVSVLLGVLIVIGWLVFYLRNNAFKSFYPVRNRHLLAEFFWSLVVIGLASTLSLPHQLGRYQRLEVLTENIDVVKEANTAALAYHFLPFEGSQFENYNSCDSLRARDSLYNALSGNESVSPENVPPPDRGAIATPDTTAERSYLHYCADPPLLYVVPQGLDRYGVDSIAKGWMMRGQREEVRAALIAYTSLVEKYGGEVRFNVERQVAEVFATPRFLVRRPSIKQYNDEYPTPTSGLEFIETHRAQDALSAITTIRRGALSSELCLVYLYWIVSAALLLFSFRITRLRTWFGAGIGVGIWMVLFAVVAALTSSEKAVLPMFFVVVISSLVFTLINLAQRRRKAASGFTFLWTVWALPVFGLALVYYIRSLVREGEYRYDATGNLQMYEPSPVALWIDGHGEVIALVNILLMLVLVALYVIPQARRWQAAPEE